MQCDVASYDAVAMQKRWLACHFLCSHQGKTVYSNLQKFKQKNNKKLLPPIIHYISMASVNGDTP